MLQLTRLAVEDLEQGCVTDEPRPRIAFSVASDREGARLSRAEVSVNGWTAETIEPFVVYAGPELAPETAYTVTVHCEDDVGERAEGATTFETGKRGAQWQAEWITDTAYRFRGKRVSPKPMSFRKQFALTKAVRRAVLRATALGVYELFINGARVGEDYFKPGFTSYRHSLQYQTYDVTEQLTQNAVLTAVVAGGWAVGAFTYKRVNRVYADRQALLAELTVDYEDGTREVFGTDGSWLVTEGGRYRAAEFYDGEAYDATVDENAVIWRNAGVEKVKLRPKLLAQYGPPVRAHERLKPVSVARTKSGELIYDFGQNFAGVISARIQGAKGQRIRFRHAELLVDGELFVKPLRSARAEAVYTAVDGVQTYAPLFTYMGFRYVGVTGIDESALELSAMALYSDVPESGSFSCSDERLNKLQSNILWSARSNFVDIPTDCPQRDERMGWTGDIAVFSPTAAFNFDTSRFLRKWLRDVAAEQRRSGGVPMTVPHVVVPGQWELMVTMAVDFWGDSCILVPWAEYLARGDKGLLEACYPVMKRYLKACKFWAGLFSAGKRRRIWQLLHHYGDWCAPGVNLWGWMRRGKWTATACWANSCGIAAKVARILGKDEDAAYYTKLRGEIAEAYRSVFTDRRGKLKKEFQTAYVLPLYFGLFREEEKAAAAANLARLVRSQGYHINTGFPGTPYILFALADNGYADDAFQMLLNESCPSWLYEVKAGATTVWERWDALREDGTCNTGSDDGTNGMVSFNHYAFGAVGDFLYRRVLGIEPAEGGYRSFRVAPLIGGGITHAEGYVRMPYGKAEVCWRAENGAFKVRLEVPVGTECALELPDGTARTLGSGTYEFDCALQRGTGNA